MPKTVIRQLENTDFPDWLPLWNANNGDKPNAAITTETWTRLTDPSSSVHGLGAFSGASMTGFVHYILHPVTGSIEPVCYMQDLFVDPAHRKKGFAKALVTELARIGARENWNRIYWLAEGKNEAAQALYKTLGVKLDFTLHVWPLGMLKR